MIEKSDLEITEVYFKLIGLGNFEIHLFKEVYYKSKLSIKERQDEAIKFLPDHLKIGTKKLYAKRAMRKLAKFGIIKKDRQLVPRKTKIETEQETTISTLKTYKTFYVLDDKFIKILEATLEAYKAIYAKTRNAVVTTTITSKPPSVYLRM